MNFINKNIFIALTVGIFLCFIGVFLTKRIKNDKINIFLISLISIISLPAISFTIYYFHFFEPPIWYIEFRAIPNIELLSCLIGFSIGYITNRYLIGFFNSMKFSVPFAIFIIAIPFLKPIVSPITDDLPDDWIDKVCLQSCGSTCGPSSLATIFKYYGISKTEKDIAENCHSCASSTEIWYLIRYARVNNLLIKCVSVDSIDNAKIPSILGTTLRKTAGHFITLLGKENEYFIIGDPLKGRLKYTKSEFYQIYELNKITYWITDEKK